MIEIMVGPAQVFIKIYIYLLLFLSVVTISGFGATKSCYDFDDENPNLHDVFPGSWGYCFDSSGNSLVELRNGGSIEKIVTNLSNVQFRWKVQKGGKLEFRQYCDGKLLADDVLRCNNYFELDRAMPTIKRDVSKIEWYFEGKNENECGLIDDICIIDNTRIVGYTDYHPDPSDLVEPPVMPSIKLISPAKNTEYYVNRPVPFEYSAMCSEAGICRLEVEGPESYRNSSILNPDNETVFKSFKDFDKGGNYSWQVIYENSKLYYNSERPSDDRLDFVVLPDNRPTVELRSPNDTEWFDVNQNITFKYVPKDDVKLKNCTLYINGLNKNFEDNPKNNIINTFTSSISQPGVHRWYIKCYDNNSKCNKYKEICIRIRPDIVRVTKNPDKYKYQYTNINEAIENVASNGTIYVEASMIDEAVIINKPVHLIGNESDGSTPIIRYNGVDSTLGVININSSDITIKGLRIISTTPYNEYSTRVSHYGIVTHIKDEDYLPPVSLEDPYYININIFNNIVEGCIKDGISLTHCKYVNITNNTLINSSKIGIRLSDCLNGTIIGNNITTNSPCNSPCKANICLGNCKHIILDYNIVRRCKLIHNFSGEYIIIGVNNSCIGPYHGESLICEPDDDKYGESFRDRNFDF